MRFGIEIMIKNLPNDWSAHKLFDNVISQIRCVVRVYGVQVVESE